MPLRATAMMRLRLVLYAALCLAPQQFNCKEQHCWPATPSAISARGFDVAQIVFLGDSKTDDSINSGTGLPFNTWPEAVRVDLSANGHRGDWVKYVRGVQGSTLVDWSNSLGWISAIPIMHETQIVLSDIGVNDLNHHGGLQSEANFLAQYDAVLVAIHNRLPTALVYITKPCMRGFTTDCVTMADYIDEVVATHSYTRAADVEGPASAAGWMENGDDYATYTYDGVHLNTSGQAEKPNRVRSILNY
jgi:lysophospholipase L1-like esterase